MNVEAPGIGEAAVAGPEFPVVVLAAAVLAAERVSGVPVRSAALWLGGEPVSVGDVDVAIEPGEANLRRLHQALAGLAIRPAAVPAVHRLREVSGVCRGYRRGQGTDDQLRERLHRRTVARSAPRW